MADKSAIKRMNAIDSGPLKKRCEYYMYEKAKSVFALTTPDEDDLLLAKALWAGQVKVTDMARIVVTNATIGAAIDNGDTPAESDIAWAITSDDAGAGSFHELAISYKSAGIIGV